MPANSLLRKIDQETIESYRLFLRLEKNLSESSVDRKLSSIKRFCDWAQSEKFLKTNPFNYIKPFQMDTHRSLYQWYRQILHYGTFVSFAYLFILLVSPSIPNLLPTLSSLLNPTPTAQNAQIASPWLIHLKEAIIDQRTNLPVTKPFRAVFALYNREKGGDMLWKSREYEVNPAENEVQLTI